jgi:zinc transport system substrate-binding protein
MMKKIAIITILALLSVGCTGKIERDNNTLFVTIAPLQQLVSEITCGDFDVEVLVPEGASPESFEPTSQHIAKLNDAALVFEIGLIDFEQSLVRNIENSERVVNLSEGIELIEGSCSHHHHGHGHSHGVDPHIWTSPRALGIMVKNIETSLRRAYPDSTKYFEAASRVAARLEALDKECRNKLESSGTKAIMIYHPAYTYLARDYSIEQITIEKEGKEPTPRQLTELVDKARKMGIKRIFHQPQYSPDKLRSIAREIGAEVVVCNPLSHDIELEIRKVVDLISRSNEQ